MAAGESAIGENRGAAAALAQKLGLSAADLEQAYPIVAGALDRLGLEGEGFVARLRAGATFAQALALPPGLRDMLYARAHNWFNVGRFDKAESLFRTLCILDGTRRDHWLGLGISLAARGKAEAGDLALQMAAQVDPNSVIAHFHLIDHAMRRGAWAAAAQWFAELDARPGERPAAMLAELERYRRALSLRGAAGQATA